jgi:hypothetical protein
MAKSKAKISAAQRDKYAIEIAKYLKKVGVLSKQAKLNQGRYISRAVLKKVQQYEYVASNRYKAAKVSRAYLQKAKEQGYEIVRGRVIVPTTRNVEKRIADGLVVGVIPVRGGTLEAVVTPYDDLSSLMKALQTGELDRLKTDEEQFMFSLFGNMNFDGAIRDSEHLYQRLMAYNSMNEALSSRPEDQADYLRNLLIYRVNRTDVRRFERDRSERVVNRKKRTGEYAKRQRRLEQMGEIAAERRRKEKALKQAKYRESLSPQQIAEQREKNRLRMQEKRKQKKT